MKVGELDILVGCDPELFLKKGRYFVSAHGMIPGTKEKPFPVEKGAIQVDGLAVEFNINPAATEDEFVGNIQSVLGSLHERLPDYKLAAIPTAHFPKKVFKESPPEALELGCEPDFNAYTREANPRPDGGAVTFRTGAGHIHIGWTKDADINDPDHIEACRMLVKELDCRLGLLAMGWDSDGERRKLYGKAGAYRVKSYGVEYRPLSNAWLRDEVLMRAVYQAVIKTVEKLLTHKKNDRFSYYYGTDVRLLLDRSDAREAKEYRNALGIILPKHFDKDNIYV